MWVNACDPCECCTSSRRFEPWWPWELCLLKFFIKMWRVPVAKGHRFDGSDPLKKLCAFHIFLIWRSTFSNWNQMLSQSYNSASLITRRNVGLAFYFKSFKVEAVRRVGTLIKCLWVWINSDILSTFSPAAVEFTDAVKRFQAPADTVNCMDVETHLQQTSSLLLNHE